MKTRFPGRIASRLVSTALPALALALAPGPATASDEPPLAEGYTCCNLHYNGDWISDANWNVNPMIPAGAPIKLLSYGRYRAFVVVDGREMRLGQDYGREQEPLEAFATKWIVPQSPKDRIAKYPEKIREAIRIGKVAVGMTREQALIAVGYPPTHQTASLDAPVWNLWTTRTGRYQVIWSADGRIKEIQGEH